LQVVVALAVGIVQFITVFIVATDIRTTAAVITIITTTTIRIIRTGQIDPTGRIDRPLYLHKDQGEAWVDPPECREAVVEVWVAVVVAVARFVRAQDICWILMSIHSWPIVQKRATASTADKTRLIQAK
jgi:hypothetical protein